jgi:sugar phosphate isomerase/epimerase
MHAHDDIRIGTLVPAHERTAEVIRQLLPHGFETFQVSFGRTVGGYDVGGLADQLRRVLDAAAVAPNDVPPKISAIGVYGNPLTSPDTVRDWERLIDSAALFDCDIVSGFAGRIPGRPVPESLVGPRTAACGSRSRTARSAARGRAATGTSPTPRPPGTRCSPRSRAR